MAPKPTDIDTDSMDATAKFMEETNDFFQENVQAVISMAGYLTGPLKKFTPSSRLFIDENGEPNVEFQGTLLYGEEGLSAQREKERERFEKKPYRILRAPIDSRGLDKHSALMMSRVMKRATSEGVEFHKHPQSRKTRNLILLGIGLGPHLDDMIEEIDPLHILMVETSFEFFYHSLRVYDWKALAQKCRDEGRRATIIIEKNPIQIALNLRVAMRAINPCSLDGTYMHQHYGNSLFANAQSEISRQLGLSQTGLGFFEDELFMLDHSYQNMKTGENRTMNARKTPAPLPAFIVGAGPSLDNDIEFIKENQDKAFIIACGSAITSLLDAGIRPDVEVYLERGVVALEVFEKVDKEYGLGDVRLIASSTVPPGITKHFKETVFFFRPGVCTFPLFCFESSQELPHCDPEAANTGFGFALSQGFREIYFLGTDLGSRDPKNNHSKKSWSTTMDMDERPGQNIRVPGNFGGSLMTTHIWGWGRDGIENAIKTKRQGRNFYNLSDGALIKGAISKRSSEVTIADPIIPKSEFVEQMFGDLPFYTEEDFERVWNKANLRNALPDFVEEILACIEGNDEPGSWKHLPPMMRVLKVADNTNALAMMLRGSVLVCLLAHEWYLTRIKDKDQLEVFWKISQEEFRTFVEEILEEALECITELEEGPQKQDKGSENPDHDDVKPDTES